MLLCVLLVCSVTVEGEGSYCTASTGYHQPSLYLRVCCVNSNLGQTVRMRENNHKKIITCPSVRPQSCPSNLDIYTCIELSKLHINLQVKTARVGWKLVIPQVVCTLLILMDRLHLRLEGNI